LASAPAEPAAGYAYAGGIAGPLTRLRRQELTLKLTNKLAEPTTLTFRPSALQRRLPESAASSNKSSNPTRVRFAPQILLLIFTCPEQARPRRAALHSMDVG
jgi:hypothetical protein